MIKRKYISYILICLALVFIVACGNENNKDNNENNNVNNNDNNGEEATDNSGFRDISPTDLKIAVGGSGGGWYIAGGAMGEKFDRNIDNLTSTLVPGGGFTNPTRVDNHQEDIGFTYTTNAVAASEGIGEYEKAHENILGLVNLNIDQFFTIMLKSDLGISSLKEMKNAKIKISPGPRGSGVDETTLLAFEEAGFNYDDIKDLGGSVQFASPDEAIDQIRDGHLDGFTGMPELGNSTWVDIAVSRDITVLQVEDDIRATLVDKYGYKEGVIPAGTYEGTNVDVDTVFNGVELVVNKNVEDDVVYNLVKVLVEEASSLKDIHSIFENFDEKIAAETAIELHPGARQYFEEAGILN